MFLIRIISAFFLFGLGLGVYYFITVRFGNNIVIDASLTAFLVFLIYLISFQALSKPSFFDSRIHKRKSDVKYKNSNLSDADIKGNLKKIKILMKDEKLYLNRSLKLQDVANKLNIGSNHVSQILNQLEHKSFVEFINSYRVEMAKTILLDRNFDKYTIEAIASESGFNNKASFNNYFKKYTSLTPKEYRKQFSSE